MVRVLSSILIVDDSGIQIRCGVQVNTILKGNTKIMNFFDKYVGIYLLKRFYSFYEIVNMI